MKINTNSWHYRLAKKLHYDVSNNLCIYFWQVVGPPLLSLILCVVLVAIVAFMIMELGILTFVLLFLGLIVVCGLVGFLTWFVCEKIEQFCEKRGWDTSLHRTTKPKKPNLFFEWIKAKKAKVCPIIEFEDEK